MEQQVSEILENILGQLSLEGSFDIEEKEDGIFIWIETEDAGKLIGKSGETLAALQLIVNLIVSKQVEGGKRIIVDVANWRKGKEEELAHKARLWAKQVSESKEALELEPMPSWQRRIVHMTIQQTSGVESESVGEGLGRHLVIRVAPESDKLDEPKKS